MHARNSIHVFVAVAAVGILAGVSGTAGRADGRGRPPAVGVARRPGRTRASGSCRTARTPAGRGSPTCCCRSWGRARAAPGDPARDLAARPRERADAPDTRAVGRPARGSARFAVVNPDGEGRPPRRRTRGERPGEIEDLARMPAVPRGRAAVAADRPPPRLRRRREHGRPGDAAPARAASGAPRGRGRVRLARRLLAPVRPVPAPALQRALPQHPSASRWVSSQCFARIEVGGDPAGAAAGYASRA